MTGNAVRMLAQAKVNLFLRVLARESDGFHGIETLFCLVDLADELVVERREAPGITLDVQVADLGPADRNLAVRAAQLVLDATGRRFGRGRGRRESRAPRSLPGWRGGPGEIEKQGARGFCRLARR